MIAATKNLSSEAKSKILEGKNNEYSLLYFPFHGVVPALRAMLAMSGAKVTFTQPDDWPVEKKQTQFGHMPILYETDPSTNQTLELTELSVLEQYIAEKYGFLGTNAWESNQILTFNSATQSLFDKFVSIVVRAPTPELRAQMREVFINTYIGEWAEFHERALQANGATGFYIGNKVSLADLKTATVAEVMRKISGEMFISEEKTPGLLKVCETVEKDERYQQWKASEDCQLFTATTKKTFGL
ncbi:hypothetical protein BGW39_006067 [Mortierella sp. 14UC]|nr:hypothetical protein BGW39_006067 [Mortierella sp. 14UC]